MSELNQAGDNQSESDFRPKGRHGQTVLLLSEQRCSIGGILCEISFRPTFADWLLWLEHDEHLLRKECGNPHNFGWAKSLLERWRSAGRPCPEEWPETRNLDWLRPRRSCWPDRVA